MSELIVDFAPLQKMNSIKCKNDLDEAVYEALKWLETEHPEQITHFWDCAFSEGIRQQYPILQLLYKKLDARTNDG